MPGVLPATGPLISLMLAVPDGPQAVAWYKDSLGATELWNLGSVAGLDLDGAPFFVHESTGKGFGAPNSMGTTTARIEVFTDDPDVFVERAVQAGAIRHPDGMVDHQMPWGIHRQGGFTDPFGHTWSVGDKSPLSRKS